jgi:hypothetical protein
MKKNGRSKWKKTRRGEESRWHPAMGFRNIQAAEGCGSSKRFRDGEWAEPAGPSASPLQKRRP